MFGNGRPLWLVPTVADTDALRCTSCISPGPHLDLPSKISPADSFLNRLKTRRRQKKKPNMANRGYDVVVDVDADVRFALLVNVSLKWMFWRFRLTLRLFNTG